MKFKTIMIGTKQFLVLLLLVLTTISCDKDFNTIGEGLVNETHFNQVVDTSSIIKTEQIIFGSTNLPNTPVQTDELPYSKLGFYNHPVYGGTTSNVVTEVALNSYGKDFGTNPQITHVVLSVPYFSSIISTDPNTEVTTYELDSVYGNTAINLKMYRSDYFLNDFDINGNSREYFSDESEITLPGLDSQLLYENSSFIPSANEVLGAVVDGETERLSPRLKDTLTNNQDFEWLFDPANTNNISSSSNFKNFYRGLYFKAEAIGLDGVLLGLDLSNANIEVFYNYDNPEDPSVPLEDSVKILFSGKKVNMYVNNDFSAPTTPQEKIYLNGGQGAMATVKLFDGVDDDGNGVSDKLDRLRDDNVLINGAELEFYVDQSVLMGGDSEPDRIFLYDVENNRVLLDYQFDTSNGFSNPNLAVSNHLGKLQRNDSGYGVKYKIDITEHITNLVRNDSTNVKLGVSVTNDVLNLAFSNLKSPINIGNTDLESIFSASILSHRGTVLYNENELEESKKLKLKIYYTEENQY